MTIKFLNAIIKNPNLKSWSNKGLGEQEIAKLEQKYNNGKKLPISIEEFLFLAGDINNIGFDTHHTIFRLQESARENLEYCGHKIDRPFFAFDHLDDCEQFTFVYLDEDQNDPDVYIAEPYYVKYGHPLVHRYRDYTFSSLVNEHIRRIKIGAPLD